MSLIKLRITLSSRPHCEAPVPHRLSGGETVVCALPACRGRRPAGQKEHLLELVHVLCYSHADIPFKFPHRKSGGPADWYRTCRSACSVTNLSLSTVINHVWLSDKSGQTSESGYNPGAYLKRAAPAAVQHQRATPDRPSTGAAIAWTEVWPTQPLYYCTQSVKVKNYQHSAIARPASLSWSAT